MRSLRLSLSRLRGRRLAWLTVVPVIVVVALLATRQGKSEVQVTPAATATATAAASSTATPTPTGTPFPTGQPGQLITNVKDLVTRFGYPPGADYAQIRIPTIGVDAKVGARTVGRDAVMAAPAGPADVVWYDLGLWDGMGGAPGEGRNAIFSGHVDYADPVPYANVSYRGQAVFSQLRLLSQGDIIEVIYKGQTLRYSVAWRRQVNGHAETTDWGSLWSSNTGGDAITLYTCGGTFDSQTREYRDRIIVRATRI